MDKILHGLRVLFIGAHPDDCDLLAGGTAFLYARAGAAVQFVSLTNGNKGHQSMPSTELAVRRKREAGRAAGTLGVRDYRVMDCPDCELAPTLDARAEVTRLIRRWAPDVIFTHRTCDYHPDHRAAGTLVMDSAYLLGVPLWCPDTPIPSVRPAVFLMRDDFTFPRPLRPDVIVPVDTVMGIVLKALACHESQFFEWLPYDGGLMKELPPADDEAKRREFIFRNWVAPRKVRDAERVRTVVGGGVKSVECFELSEYGYQPSPEEMKRLFPFTWFSLERNS